MPRIFCPELGTWLQVDVVLLKTANEFARQMNLHNTAHPRVYVCIYIGAIIQEYIIGEWINICM